MSSRPSFRTSSSSRRSGALTVAAALLTSALAACGNIGLESSAPAGSGPTGGYGDQDATGAFQSDAAGTASPPGSADAAATPTRGSALCNWAYVSGGDP